MCMTLADGEMGHPEEPTLKKMQKRERELNSETEEEEW